MAKKRKRARTAAASRHANAASARQQNGASSERASPGWKWRTFPVFLAFVAGALVASVVNPPSGTVGYVVQLAAIAGVGYGIAHLFVTNVIVAGRLRRRREGAARGEEPPEAYEEELVYPDDETAPDR
jgi:hypothetical protein